MINNYFLNKVPTNLDLNNRKARMTHKINYILFKGYLESVGDVFN